MESKEIVLGYNDPNEFRNRSAKISKEGNTTDIQIVGPETNFQEMMKNRVEADADKIYRGLREGGYEFANLGLSGLFTIEIDGEDYVICAEQERVDVGDSAAKLISGYIEALVLYTPIKCLEDELSEEVLPVTSDKRIIRFERNGHPLEKPFTEHFEDYNVLIDIKPPARYEAPSLEEAVTLEGKPIEGNPGLYYQVPTNSAQLVFSYHLDQRDIDFKKLKVSLNHSEDKFNPKEKRLDVMYHPAGIILLKLENNELTDYVYNLINGNFVDVDPRKIVLSEAFALKEEGIVKDRNISLIDYLKR